MSYLTPQQQAAIQAAGQAGAGATGNGVADTTIGAAMNNSLAGSGLFDPAQLSAVNAGWNTSGNWGSGAPTPDVWDSAMTNALNGVGQNQATVGQFQQNPNTPNAQAISGGYNPLQPAYLNQPATLNATTVNPQYANTAQLSPQLMNSLGSGQTINALVGANQPQFQQQDQQMMQMLATAGLAPSSTAGQTAFNNLAQQQLAGMDPSIAAAIQNSQANQLNAGQYNTSAQNTGNQFNATTGNTAGQYNANAMNAAAGTNLQNQNNQQLYNANAYNTAGNNYFNAETGAYNNNANAFNSLNNAGLSGAQNLAGQQASGGTQLASGQQGTFPVYSNPYSGVSASSFGSAGQYPQPSTTNNYYGTQTQAGGGGLAGYYGQLDSSGGQ